MRENQQEGNRKKKPSQLVLGNGDRVGVHAKINIKKAKL
jgi:hypothetical protein